MRAYILIESEVGRASEVAKGVKGLKFDKGTVVSVDAVTGPFDVIVQLEAEDLEGGHQALEQVLRRYPLDSIGVNTRPYFDVAMVNARLGRPGGCWCPP